MEWVLRQVCFSSFVLLVGTLLSLSVLPARAGTVFLESRRLSIPILLYAAAELLCYGRGAAVLLPIRMLELAYGTCLYMGLCALVRLLRDGRGRRILTALVFPAAVLESALLGYVLLRDGYCRGASAAAFGAAGMAAAAMLLVFGARRAGKAGQAGRSAR